MKPVNWNKLKPKFSITSRILFYFLTLIILSLLLIGYVGIRGANEAGRITIESNAYLSGYITSSSIGVLEAASKKLVSDKALEVAKTVNMYLESYPVLSIDILSQNVY